jgi:hypothetical protein
MSVCLFVCLCVCFFQRSVPIGREPTNRDAEFFGAVKGSIPIGRKFWLVGNRPIGTRSFSELSKGAFRLVRGTKRSDWSGTDQSGHGVGQASTSLTHSKFFEAVKRSVFIGRGTKCSDWSGTDQSGHGVLSGRQTQPSDWSGNSLSVRSCGSGQRSDLIGRDQSGRRVLRSCETFLLGGGMIKNATFRLMEGFISTSLEGSFWQLQRNININILWFYLY